jgi:hypothetical protein
MDSGILMIQDSILVCSPDLRIPHTAGGKQDRGTNNTSNTTKWELTPVVTHRHCFQQGGVMFGTTKVTLWLVVMGQEKM